MKKNALFAIITGILIAAAGCSDSSIDLSGYDEDISIDITAADPSTGTTLSDIDTISIAVKYGIPEFSASDNWTVCMMAVTKNDYDQSMSCEDITDSLDTIALSLPASSLLNKTDFASPYEVFVRIENYSDSVETWPTRWKESDSYTYY